MKRIFDRLMTYRMNASLWKKIFKNEREGILDRDNAHYITVGANLVFLSFLVRFFARLWMTGALFLKDHAIEEVWLFVRQEGLLLLVFFLAYTFFANYLLGLSFRDRKIKCSTKRYCKVFFFLPVYLLELIISFFYFMGLMYDFYFLSLLGLGSLLVTIYAYVVLSLSILDFCIYTTDNSDDIEPFKGEHIDYF